MNINIIINIPNAHVALFTHSINMHIAINCVISGVYYSEDKFEISRIIMRNGRSFRGRNPYLMIMSTAYV